MSLVPWDPFRNLVALQDRMNRMFEETVQAGKETGMMRPGTWAPAVDIYEDEEEVVLVAEVPGIEMEDVDIQVRDNTLTLKGERKMEKPVNKENYHRVERTYGSFMRAFTLPSTVDQDKISANYAKGVLEIKMPKSARSKPTQIKIDVKE
jgi:HSP20 family protein